MHMLPAIFFPAWQVYPRSVQYGLAVRRDIFSLLTSCAFSVLSSPPSSEGEGGALRRDHCAGEEVLRMLMM